MSRRLAFASCLLATSLLAACGGDDDDDDTPRPDAAAGPDAAVDTPDGGGAADAGADAGPTPDAAIGAQVGAACTADGNCAGGVCIGEDQGFPGGYCSSFGCDLDDAEGSCLAFGGDGLCLDIGDPGAPFGVCLDTCDPLKSDCRDLYECVQVDATHAVCLAAPVCGNGEVERGEECEPPGTSECDDLCQGTGSDPVGAACADPSSCSGDTCIGEDQGFLGGYCTQFDCDLGAPATSCLDFGGDGICLDVGDEGEPFGVCFDTCTPGGTDCRSDYDCVDLGGGAAVCLPAPVCGNDVVEDGEECEPPGTDTCDANCQGVGGGPIGGACADALECAGDLCITDDDGFPMGYCSQLDCDLSAADTSCDAFGGDGVCLDVGDPGDPFGICFDSCTSGGDCRTGYNCDDIGGGVSICQPAPVCGNGDVEGGEECEPPGTATCDADCQGTGTTPTGGACADPADCAGDLCITDEDGFPLGYCSQLDCDLAAPTTACDAVGGGICLDVGDEGDPFGICFDTCTPGGTDCRTGYSCDDIGGGVSICQPEPVCGNDVVESGEECEPPGTATCTDTCQGTGTGPVGAACNDAAECAGDLCIPSPDFPAGYCSDEDCDLGDPDASCLGAGGDGICLDVGDVGEPFGICFDVCDLADPDCRADYDCTDIGGGVSICLPAPVCGNGEVETGEECEPPGVGECNTACQGTGSAAIGAACESNVECAGNLCITDEEGFPLGYCSHSGCDLATASSSCLSLGGDGVCVDDGTGTGLCLDVCSGGGMGGCRTDYTCTRLGPGVRVCLP